VWPLHGVEVLDHLPASIRPGNVTLVSPHGSVCDWSPS
jgi:hypothetical protein